MRDYMLYYSYDNDEILIMHQDLPEVATTQLYHKGEPVMDKPELVILSTICLCKWYVNIDE